MIIHPRDTGTIALSPKKTTTLSTHIIPLSVQPVPITNAQVSSSSSSFIDGTIVKRVILITVVFLLVFTYIRHSSKDTLSIYPSSTTISLVIITMTPSPPAHSLGISSNHASSNPSPSPHTHKRKGTVTPIAVTATASPLLSAVVEEEEDDFDEGNKVEEENHRIQNTTITPSPNTSPVPSVIPTVSSSIIPVASAASLSSSTSICLNNELIYVGTECIYTDSPGSFTVRVDDNYFNHGLTMEPFTTVSNYVNGKDPESTHRCLTWKKGQFKNYSVFSEQKKEECIADVSFYQNHFPKHAYSVYPTEVRAYTSTVEWQLSPITVIKNNSVLPPSSISSCSDTTKPFCGWKYWSEIDPVLHDKRKEKEIFRGYLYDPNDDECCFPPYISHAKRKHSLSGERIAMVGDSIMRQLFTQVIATLRGLHYAFDIQHHQLNRHIMNWETNEDTYQPCITAHMLLQNIANDITHIWPPNFPASVSTDTTFFWNPLFQDSSIDDTVASYEPTVLIAGLHFWEDQNTHHNLNAVNWLFRTLERNSRIRKVVWTLPPCWGNYESIKRPNEAIRSALRNRGTYLENALRQILRQTEEKRTGSRDPLPVVGNPPEKEIPIPIPEISSLILPDRVELMIVDTCRISRLPLIDPYRVLDGFHFTCIANPEALLMHPWIASSRTTPIPPPALLVLPPMLNHTCSDPYTYNIVRQILSALSNS